MKNKQPFGKHLPLSVLKLKNSLNINCNSHNQISLKLKSQLETRMMHQSKTGAKSDVI